MGVSRLLQGRDISAMIDMVRVTIEDERWHGFYSSCLRFSDTIFALSEMDDLNVVTVGIERLRNVLLGGDADRTSRMIEDGF